MKTLTVTEIISRYRLWCPEENIEPLTRFTSSNTDLTSRHNYTGHITGSVVLVDRNKQILLIQNPKFPGLLVFPGGHIEASDASIESGAQREFQEELGLSCFPGDIDMGDGIPLDIDIHEVPENHKKNEPKHTHFDFRFAYLCEQFPVFLSDALEVEKILLIAVDKLKQNPMRSRVAHKLEQKISSLCI